MKILEICVDSLQSALTAQSAGADRIELCAGLDLGGLTPDQALFGQTREKLNIPIHVLIRPRSGNFVYNTQDEEMMRMSIRYFKEQGANGLVFGALTSGFEVDRLMMERLMEDAYPLPVTFHRAFDQIPDPLGAISALNSLGLRRLLTSGQSPSAVDGISLLKALLPLVEDPLTILPGGGINSTNVSHFLKLGLPEIHASAREKAPETNAPDVPLSANGMSDNYRFTSYEEVKRLRTTLDHHET